MYHKSQHIHFVGIGGIGMSGIAELLLNLGHIVSGSDIRPNDNTERLSAMGAKIFLQHSPDNIGQADVVVYSSAVSGNNTELMAARGNFIPVISRAEMLAELMRLKYGIAVAGAHGKTTTTSLLAFMLASSGLDPTFIVGGRLNALGFNAYLGKGDFLVAEADESDGSFNMLNPVLVIVTNIDREHMEHYGTDEALDQAFVDFMNKVPFYGAAVICLENERIASLLPSIRKRVITYGYSSQADFQAKEIIPTQIGSKYLLCIKGQDIGEVILPFPGRHFALNSLAALAIAHEIGVDIKQAAEACAKFTGVKRRFEAKGHTFRQALVVDDYAHHPTEIKATLEAARSLWPEKKIILCFQPHRYTRTNDLWDMFAQAFYDADELLLLDIYAAGEKPIEGINARNLSETIKKHGHRKVEYLSEANKIITRLLDSAGEGDIIITMGAGDVYKISDELVKHVE